MTELLLVPLVACATAAAGWGLCTAAGWDAHGRQMLLAGVICVVSAAGGLAPLRFLRIADPATRAQAALGGLAMHMLASALLAALAGMTGLAGDSRAFVLWLMAMFWATLSALAISMVRIVRAATAPTMGEEKP